MVKNNTLLVRLVSLLLILGLGISAQARDTDCNLDFSVENDCGDDGGYALVTDIVSAITPYSILWSTGQQTAFVAGLPNGDHSVTVTDAAGCSATKYFSVDCQKKDHDDDKKDPDPEPEPCQLRTQTMGGWGAKPSGNNPASYLHAHFAAAFPGGLTIGCENTLSLTSAQAVRNFLPSGSQPNMLPSGALVNPGKTYKNVLAGQLVALTLSVGFDSHDPDFGPSGYSLGASVINSGLFQGWTVQELLDEANNFIGGCGSSFTASQLNTALDMVNNNFVDGTGNNGKVDCYKKEDEHQKMQTPAAIQKDQEGDCNLDFAVENDCGDDGGYALVTDIVSAITPYSILWSTGQQTAFVVSLPNGDHSVTVTDAAGCSATKYFSVDCAKKEHDDPEPEPCQLRTQTMGGWGAKPSGNNPASYLHANFAAAFPGGLTIGCENTLTLTSAQAVRNFLPSGSTASMLPSGALVNPGNTYKNVLAGQLVALTLSVGFDSYDPNFGPSGYSLAAAVINSGLFQGWTVQELLDEANNFIGGCGSSFTASQINSALDMVNNNFVDGTGNNGKVDCYKKEDEHDKLLAAPAAIADLLAFPNPASHQLNLQITAGSTANVSLMMMDATGRLAMPTAQVSLQEGEQRIITLDVNNLANGTYILSLEHGAERSVQRIVIAR